MDKKIKLEMNKNKDIVISVNDDEKITQMVIIFHLR